MMPLPREYVVELAFARLLPAPSAWKEVDKLRPFGRSKLPLDRGVLHRRLQRLHVLRALERHCHRFWARHAHVPLEASRHPFATASVGMLLALWDHSPWHDGDCPACGGPVRGWSATGMAGCGGYVNGTCLGCGREFGRWSKVPMQTHETAILKPPGMGLAERAAWGWMMNAPSEELLDLIRELDSQVPAAGRPAKE